MRVLGAVAAMTALVWMVALSAPARAQVGDGSGGGGPHINMLADQPSKTPEEIEKEQARDKAYKESLKKIPEAKSADPWGGVRSSDAAKPSTSSKTSATAKKTKTGSNAN
jgi:hypothetical protein